MARKAVERNISYDDVRQLYYVSMELGRDENGKRIKQYRTFPTLTAARNGLRDFHTQRERQAREPQDEVREEMDLAHWLEYWMESIVRPNRAETTVYAYQKIIDNHILPALGGIPMSRLSAKRIQRYYTDTQQAAGCPPTPCGGTTTFSPAPCAPRCGRICFWPRPWTGWSRRGPGSMRPSFMTMRN